MPAFGFYPRARTCWMTIIYYSRKRSCWHTIVKLSTRYFQLDLRIYFFTNRADPIIRELLRRSSGMKYYQPANAEIYSQIYSRVVDSSVEAKYKIWSNIRHANNRVKCISIMLIYLILRPHNSLCYICFTTFFPKKGRKGCAFYSLYFFSRIYIYIYVY